MDSLISLCHIIGQHLDRKGNYFPPSKRYFLVNKLGKELYPAVYPDFRKYWKYSPSDFYRLENDKTILHICDSGDLDIYSTK